jgi:hypothetical protein
MMNRLKFIKLIPRRTLIIQLSWLGLLLLLCLGVTWPLQGSISSLDKDIKNIQSQIETQKNLQPIYQSLKAKSQAPPASVLPTPEMGKLSRNLVTTVPSTIKGAARDASMEIISVSPDARSLTDKSGQLQVHTVVQGKFMDFRKFLIGIAALGYVERFESVEIQQNADVMEFRINIWIALGS